MKIRTDFCYMPHAPVGLLTGGYQTNVVNWSTLSKVATDLGIVDEPEVAGPQIWSCGRDWILWRGKSGLVSRRERVWSVRACWAGVVRYLRLCS